MVKKMTDKEADKFQREHFKWLDYKNIEDFKEDVVTCLVYSSWHYSEEDAREIVDKLRKDYIEEAYRDKEPAYDVSCEAGYFAG